jgi:hypothetical protein
MAPELFVDLVDQSALGEDAVESVPPFSTKVTKETDLFAYSLVSLQVCCLAPWKPYSDFLSLFIICILLSSYFPCSQILTGKSPLIHQIIANKIQVQLRRERYDLRRTMDDRLWNLFNQCCDIDPRKRPVMDEVTRCIRNIHPFSQMSSHWNGDSHLLCQWENQYNFSRLLRVCLSIFHDRSNIQC